MFEAFKIRRAQRAAYKALCAELKPRVEQAFADGLKRASETVKGFSREIRIEVEREATYERDMVLKGLLTDRFERAGFKTLDAIPHGNKVFALKVRW